MARRVVWSASAWQELECAASFIERDSRRYAAALIEQARDAARSLRRFPTRGRVVPEVGVENIRELLIGNYRMIYDLQHNRTVVIAFIHGARRLPPNLS